MIKKPRRPGFKPSANWQGGPRHGTFGRIRNVIGRGEQLSEADGKELIELLDALLTNQDVRPWFYVKPKGRRSDWALQLWVALDVELRRRAGAQIKTAIPDVAKHWDLAIHQVKRLRTKGNPEALRWIKDPTINFENALRKSVDGQARRYRNQRKSIKAR